MKKETKALTLEDVCLEDRGEREYYNSKIDAKNKKTLSLPLRLPITEDGVLCLLELVTGGLDIPMTDTIIEVFCGYVHHMSQTTKHTTFDELGARLYKHMANHVTWKMDQDCKDRAKEKKEAARLEAARPEAEKTPATTLTLAKDADETKEAGPNVQ